MRFIINRAPNSVFKLRDNCRMEKLQIRVYVIDIQIGRPKTEIIIDRQTGRGVARQVGWNLGS
jgi:hypothetical protein